MEEDRDDIERLIREYELDKKLSTATTNEYGEGDSKKTPPKSLNYGNRANKRDVLELSREIGELATKLDELYAKSKRDGKDEETIRKIEQEYIDAWQRRKSLQKSAPKFDKKMNGKLFEKFIPIREKKQNLENDISHMEEGSREYQEALKRLEKIEDEYIDIRNRLVENNIRLVYYTIEEAMKGNLKYLGNSIRALPLSDYPFADRIQEGFTGLINAVENYEPAIGEFSTYAVTTIAYNIKNGEKGRNIESGNEINNARNIHVPSEVLENYNRINRVRMNLEEQLGREPTYEELEEIVGIKSNDIERIEIAYNLAKTESLDQDTGIVHTEDGQEINVENATNVPLFDYYYEKQDETDLKKAERQKKNKTKKDFGGLRQGTAKVDGEVLPVEEDIPFETAEGNYVAEQLAKLVNILNPREKEIVEERYGLIDGKPKSLKELGIKYEISGESVRGILNNAMRKLRTATYSNHSWKKLSSDVNDDFHVDSGAYLKAKQEIAEKEEFKRTLEAKAKRREDRAKELFELLYCSKEEANLVAYIEMPDYKYRNLADVAKQTGKTLEEVTSIVNSVIDKIEFFRENSEFIDQTVSKVNREDDEQESQEDEKVSDRQEEEELRTRLEQSIAEKIETIEGLKKDENRNQQDLQNAMEEYDRLKARYDEVFPKEKNK